MGAGRKGREDREMERGRKESKEILKDGTERKGGKEDREIERGERKEKGRKERRHVGMESYVMSTHEYIIKKEKEEQKKRRFVE